MIVKRWSVVLVVLLVCGLAVGASAQDSLSTDVVVVGGGSAGLAAAIEARAHGADVILLEKLPFLGGSSLVSGGGLVAAGTRMQQEADIEDSAEALVADWLAEQEYGREGVAPAEDAFVELIAQKGYEITAWLEDEIGVEFGPRAGLGRYHAPAEGRGYGLIGPMQQKAEELGTQILLETPAVALLTDGSGRVTGVEAVRADGSGLTIEAGAVILATGGFPHNQDLMEEFVPDAAHSTTYSTPGATGDGLLMAREVGADIIESAWVIGYVGSILNDRPYYDPINRMAWGNGLHVNSLGLRFGDESLPYYRYFVEMAENGDSYYYLIYDASGDQELLAEAIEAGVAWKADSIEELAAEAGIWAGNGVDGLVQTVERYNRFAEQGLDEDFDKNPDHLEPLTTAPFYAVVMEPNNIGTMGGPRITLDGEVLDTNGEVIPGLYAAGEVANKQFYQDMYVGGSALAVSLTMGKITGAHAAGQ